VKRLKFKMILFLADVRVKVNRETLLCKRNGGDTPGRSAGGIAGSASQEPVLTAKLFHKSDRRQCAYVIGGHIAKAMTAKEDCSDRLQFFIVEPTERNGNVVAAALVAINHGRV
jgi:hypothetical protein